MSQSQTIVRLRSRPADRIAGRLVFALLLAPACASSPQSDAKPTRALSITRIAELRLAGDAVAIAVAGQVVFVGCGDSGVIAIDVSEPLAPEIIGSVESVRADVLAYSEDRLFALGRPRSLEWSTPQVLTPIDSVDPRAPRALEKREIPDARTVAASAARCMVATSNKLLVGAENRQPTPREIAPDGIVTRALAWRGERAGVLTTPRSGWLGATNDGAVLRIFHSSKATLLGEIALRSIAPIDDAESAGLLLTSDRAYVAAGGRLVTVDLTVIAEPRIVQDAPLADARGIALGNGFLAVMTSGLAVIDLHAGAEPVIADVIQVGQEARGARAVAASGDLVFVAAGELGLRVYRVARAEDAAAAPTSSTSPDSPGGPDDPDGPDESGR